MTGEELKSLLDRHGVKPVDLAKRLNVTRAAVYKWLSGERSISSVSAIAIAAVLADDHSESGKTNNGGNDD